MAIEAFSVVRAGIDASTPIWATEISAHQFNYYQCSFFQHQTLNREDISNNVGRQYPVLLAFKVLQFIFCTFTPICAFKILLCLRDRSLKTNHGIFSFISEDHGSQYCDNGWLASGIYK